MDLVTHRVKLLHKWADSLVELELTRRGADVTSVQAHILVALLDIPAPPSQKALADALGMDRMTTLDVVRRMETRGLVTRTRVGRESLVKLTDEGAALAFRSRRALLAAQRAIREILPGLEAGLASFGQATIDLDH